MGLVDDEGGKLKDGAFCSKVSRSWGERLAGVFCVVPRITSPALAVAAAAPSLYCSLWLSWPKSFRETSPNLLGVVTKKLVGGGGDVAADIDVGNSGVDEEAAAVDLGVTGLIFLQSYGVPGSTFAAPKPCPAPPTSVVAP